MSFTMTLLVIAASVALVLAVIGLYARDSVHGQPADPRDWRAAGVGRPASRVPRHDPAPESRCCLLGVVLGLLTASGLTRVLSSLLFDVSAHDWVTFGAAAIAITAVSAVATYLSTRRVTQVDPVVALKYE